MQEDKFLHKSQAEHAEHAESFTDEKGRPKQQSLGVLAHLTEAQVFADVEQFCHDHGFVDQIDLFKRAARVAHNPHEIATLPDLTDDERRVCMEEHTHKWRHPIMMYLTIFICSIGAATQGWDQTGSNGANLSFPDAFGIADNQWLIGLINGAPYLASAAIGCWISDPLNFYLGRRMVIFLTALCLIATPISSGFAKSWGSLLASRLVLGLGMGVKGSTVPIFAAENSPASIRGALVMSWQLWTAFGIFLGFAANLIVTNWRLQLGSAMIPAVPLAFGIFFCPESARWLVKKGRYQKAFKSLKRLRFTEIQAARDLYTIHYQYIEETKLAKPSTFFGRITELFTIPRVRRATLAAHTVMLAQQMCGINIIAFYSSTIFVEAGGYTPRQALGASLGFGAVNFVFAFPALFTIDTFGRRTLLLFTFPQMAWTLLAAGLCFLIPEGTARLALVATFIFLFAAFYSPGEGPVPFTYSAEVFPLAQREIGMGFSVAVCLGWAFVLSLTFPRMLEVMGATGAFGFYAGLNVLAFIMIIFWVPETKGLTLEEMDFVFDIPTREFAAYQVKHAIPYWFKRYVFFNKSARLTPLIEMRKGISSHHA